MMENYARSRADLVDLLAPPRGQREDLMLAALMGALDRVPEDDARAAGRYAVAVMARWRDGRAISDVDFLAAGVAMSLGAARDEVWKVLSCCSAPDWLRFWEEVLTRTPRGVRVAVLAVTGLVAWVAGDLVVAEICLSQAEAEDGDYPLVRLLGQIVEAGLPGGSWEEWQEFG